MPKKSCPILYSKLPYKVGQDFLDIQYTLYTYNIGDVIVASNLFLGALYTARYLY